MPKLNVSKHQYTNSIKIPLSEPTPPTSKPVEEIKPIETSITKTALLQSTENGTSAESNEYSRSNSETENRPIKTVKDNLTIEGSPSSDFPSVSLDFSNVASEVPMFIGNQPTQEAPSPSIIPRESSSNQEYDGITGLHKDFRGGGKPESRSIRIDTNDGENQTYVNGTAVPNNGIHITIKGDNNTININTPEAVENKDNLPSEKDILGVSSLEELSNLTDRLGKLNRLVDAKRIILEAERKYL